MTKRSDRTRANEFIERMERLDDSVPITTSEVASTLAKAGVDPKSELARAMATAAALALSRHVGRETKKSPPARHQRGAGSAMDRLIEHLGQRRSSFSEATYLANHRDAGDEKVDALLRGVLEEEEAAPRPRRRKKPSGQKR